MAFDRICYLDSEVAMRSEWYIRKEERDIAARKSYKEIRNEKWQRGETYIMQILEEEIKADDIRLRPTFTE